MKADEQLEHDIAEGYFWPSREAVLFLNDRLKLPADGSEQDWEATLVDHDRLGEFIDVLSSGGLDLECRSALALLLSNAVVFGFHEDATGTVVYGEDIKVVAADLRLLLQSDPSVLARMRSNWGRFWAKEILPEDEPIWQATTTLLGDFARRDPFAAPARDRP